MQLSSPPLILWSPSPSPSTLILLPTDLMDPVTHATSPIYFMEPININIEKLLEGLRMWVPVRPSH